jgi:hypothetical protein
VLQKTSEPRVHFVQSPSIDAQVCQNIHEFVSFLSPRFSPNTIKPKIPIKREEDGRCTVYTVGPDNSDDTVRKLRVRGARFWLSTTSRSVGNAPISAVAREREIDACQEPFKVSRTLSLALALKHHLRECVNVQRKAAGLHL